MQRLRNTRASLPLMPMIRVSLLALASLWVLTGCQKHESASPESIVEVEGDVAIVGDWQTLFPEGETTCSDGSPYKFFVRQGASDKLLIYLQGGGACWFRQTCDPEMTPSYTLNVANTSYPYFGIFNFAKADNPFKNHTVVYAPYCTGDVHIGASNTIYPPVEEGQKELVIRHQGRANMQAVLDWTYANVKSPKNIFVTGSSAGAIPSPFYASLIADHYPDARVGQLGDGAGGYRRMNQATRPHEQWGTFNFINDEKGFEELNSHDMNYESLYIAAAQQHPEILFAEYDAAEDAVQKRFLALSGQKNVQLLDSLKANHQDIRAKADNFRSFIGGGTSHTVLQRPEFYTWAANGTGIRDWVANLESFADVENVTCVDCARESYVGVAIDPALQALWDSWEDPATQYVKPFKIFDNVYYVGIDWVSAYLIDTGDGLVLIDSLYGKWVPLLMNNIRAVGFNPSDIKYVINTHGHFDHAGGSAYLQKVHGAEIVMTAEDWAIARAEPELPQFYMPQPNVDIVAKDGDTITLGDNTFELFNTPGHTTGVLSIRYTVREGDNEYTAMTLGGVGLNFSGVARTETYIKSYERLQSIQNGTSVSLPNHQEMGKVFARRDLAAAQPSGAANPFVNPDSYKQDLSAFLTAAKVKLAQEKAGTAPTELEALKNAITDS